MTPPNTPTPDLLTEFRKVLEELVVHHSEHVCKTGRACMEHAAQSDAIRSRLEEFLKPQEVRPRPAQHEGWRSIERGEIPDPGQPFLARTSLVVGGEPVEGYAALMIEDGELRLSHDGDAWGWDLKDGSFNLWLPLPVAPPVLSEEEQKGCKKCGQPKSAPIHEDGHEFKDCNTNDCHPFICQCVVGPGYSCSCGTDCARCYPEYVAELDHSQCDHDDDPADTAACEIDDVMDDFEAGITPSTEHIVKLRRAWDVLKSPSSPPPTPAPGEEEPGFDLLEALKRSMKK